MAIFSQRFPLLTPEPSPLWSARTDLSARGIRVFDLTLGNPTAVGIPYPAELAGLLGQPSILAYRPDSRGHLEAREAIARYLSARGRPCRSGDLLLTSSTSEAYGFLFKLLCDPGDEILLPCPTYPLFDALAELEHVHLVRFPLLPVLGDVPAAAATADQAAQAPGSRVDGSIHWRPDMDFLSRLVSTRSRALILVNPNNPTGHMPNQSEIRDYLAFAREHGLALIVDEVFSDYLLGHASYLPIQGQGPLIFTLNGLSKLAGLPQVKLGWIHIAGEEGEARLAMEHLEWIADAYLSVNTPVQVACAGLLDLAPPIQALILARLKANLRFAQDCCAAEAGSKVRLLAPEAGWYLVLKVENTSNDEDFALDLLRQRHVHVHPGTLFGFQEKEGAFHLVLSLLPPETEFQAGLIRLVQALSPGS